MSLLVNLSPLCFGFYESQLYTFHYTFIGACVQNEEKRKKSQNA